MGERERQELERDKEIGGRGVGGWEKGGKERHPYGHITLSTFASPFSIACQPRMCVYALSPSPAQKVSPPSKATQLNTSSFAY